MSSTKQPKISRHFVEHVSIQISANYNSKPEIERHCCHFLSGHKETCSLTIICTSSFNLDEL